MNTMVASVAVLSDIHGVLPALDAVLAEPAVQAAERIVLTGEIAAGPQPVQVLDRLLGLGDRVTWVRGNADRELVELARGQAEAGDIPDPIAPWAARQLSADHVDWLARLPYPVTLNVEGFGDVVFGHAAQDGDPERGPQPQRRPEQAAQQRAQRPGAVVDGLEGAGHPGSRRVRDDRGEDRPDADVQHHDPEPGSELGREQHGQDRRQGTVR